jgi:hypothetical protein
MLTSGGARTQVEVFPINLCQAEKVLITVALSPCSTEASLRDGFFSTF